MLQLPSQSTILFEELDLPLCPGQVWTLPLQSMPQRDQHESHLFFCFLLNQVKKKKKKKTGKGITPKQKVCVYVLSHSVMSNSETPWTGAHQAPLPMGFSRQEYWSGLLFPLPGDGIFPTQGSNLPLLCLLHCKQILYSLSRWGSLS